MSKYHNKVIYVNGEKFDSKKEYSRYKELQLLQRAGVIHGLRRQVPYVLIDTQRKKGEKTRRMLIYRADFVYWEKGEEIVEDCKGFVTDVFRIKEMLMWEKYHKWIRRT